ncbi:Carnitine O-acetyltransferase [Operophtera brumata]|uniref:Carnitine O-acetyltransferase n=1 Tax=Operophtera brumata TaxID=104452 RepID=A0A0L7LN62_OPEBR|nr:Carnitine O-acetyltransferase [Operophtera brumata]
MLVTFQFIVGADGVTGLTYEHSPAEGQPIAVMTDYIINYIEQNKAGKKTPSAKPKEPRLLKFNVNSEVAGFIKTAAGNLDK